jgi:SAM-dependent methyltransferase
MSRYYPSTYYSFSSEPPNEGLLYKWAKRERAKYAVCGKGVMGRLLYRRFPNPALRSLSRFGHMKGARILDVGCGSGSVLYALRQIGFTNLMGVDPYIDDHIRYKNGVCVLKTTIEALTGQWDVIMFHHSLEHASRPLDQLRAASRLLSDDGVCIVRIPVVSSFAWEHYGVHWVQLDAPRHLFLHSSDSMAMLTTQAGLKVDDIVFDSTALQFWGSEQYLRDIPLRSERSYAVNPSKGIFSRDQIEAFERRAEQLNASHRGDQAAFYLRKR